jgi:hypothetical protein
MPSVTQSTNLMCSGMFHLPGSTLGEMLPKIYLFVVVDESYRQTNEMSEARRPEEA